jgi:hypothetical protein
MLAAVAIDRRIVVGVVTLIPLIDARQPFHVREDENDHLLLFLFA